MSLSDFTLNHQNQSFGTLVMVGIHTLYFHMDLVDMDLVDMDLVDMDSKYCNVHDNDDVHDNLHNVRDGYVFPYFHPLAY